MLTELLMALVWAITNMLVPTTHVVVSLDGTVQEDGPLEAKTLQCNALVSGVKVCQHSRH